MSKKISKKIIFLVITGLLAQTTTFPLHSASRLFALTQRTQAALLASRLSSFAAPTVAPALSPLISQTKNQNARYATQQAAPTSGMSTVEKIKNKLKWAALKTSAIIGVGALGYWFYNSNNSDNTLHTATPATTELQNSGLQKSTDWFANFITPLAVNNFSDKQLAKLSQEELIKLYRKLTKHELPKFYCALAKTNDSLLRLYHGLINDQEKYLFATTFKRVISCEEFLTLAHLPNALFTELLSTLSPLERALWAEKILYAAFYTQDTEENKKLFKISPEKIIYLFSLLDTEKVSTENKDVSDTEKFALKRIFCKTVLTRDGLHFNSTKTYPEDTFPLEVYIELFINAFSQKKVNNNGYWGYFCSTNITQNDICLEALENYIQDDPSQLKFCTLRALTTPLTQENKQKISEQTIKTFVIKHNNIYLLKYDILAFLLDSITDQKTQKELTILILTKAAEAKTLDRFDHKQKSILQNHAPEKYAEVFKA